MDQFMVDVTDIPDVKIGDEVTLIGRDGDEVITMEEVGTFPADLIMSLSACLENVFRVFFIEMEKNCKPGIF